MVKQDVVMGILESCPFLWQSVSFALWNAQFLVRFLQGRIHDQLLNVWSRDIHSHKQILNKSQRYSW